MSGEFSLRLEGRGKNVESADIENAWVHLPTGTVQLWKDGALTDAVTQSAPSDRLRVYAQDARDLVFRPDLCAMLNFTRF